MFSKIKKYVLGTFSFDRQRVTNQFSNRSSKYFETYKREVVGDIRALEKICELNPVFFERNQHPLFTHFFEKYTEDYCPSKLKEVFSFDQQTEYFWLRQRVDELLSENGPGGI